MNAIYHAWIAHCKNRYPREFAYFEPSLDHVIRSKTDIHNNLAMIGIVDAHRNWTSCYITVYAFESWHGRPQNAIIDRVYLDLDHETEPQNAIDDAIKLIEGLQKFGIKASIYFSGMKGIAIYIDFEPVHIAPENKKDTVAAFQHTLMRRFDLHLDKDGGTVDSHIIGDINRVSRLPNTKHQSSGLYCVPVTRDELKEGIDYIRDLAHNPRDLPIEVNNNTVMPDYMHRLEQHVIKDREERRIIDGLTRLEQRYQPHRYGGKSKDENIANILIDTLKRTGYLEHNQRLGLVWLLDDLDWTKGEIVDLFLSNVSDADRGITEYQVNDILNRKRGGGG